MAQPDPSQFGLTATRRASLIAEAKQLLTGKAEKWISWDEWMELERNRIFKSGYATRKRMRAEEDAAEAERIKSAGQSAGQKKRTIKSK